METLRILVTDDEPGMRSGVERTLRGFSIHVPDAHTDVDFTVQQAETGEEALEAIATTPPDILLLDHKLPGISGLDVLDQIADKKTDMLTVMITAYASIETAVTATKRGAYDFLAKPFTPDELKERIRKAASRIVLAKKARKLEAEKRQVRFQFIRVLGHELKAPLNAIDGYLRIVQSQTLGKDITAYEQAVSRSLTRIEGMRKLIVDLLDMTRIESGQRDRDLARIDLSEVARMSIETVQPEAQARGITLALDAEQPFEMVADRGEMEIILNNLLSNAVKYNRQDGRVDVTLARDNGKIIIKVRDTGIGLTDAEKAKLFGEFVRIKNDKTLHVLGSGLGLSIVQKIATLYNGSASVDSVPDQGSTFTVVLQSPAQNKEMQPAVAAEERN